MSPQIDYECAPDLPAHQNLTTDRLFLFQLYKRPEDTKRIEREWHDLVTSHIKLCELTILRYAMYGFYWAELPNHPLQDVNTSVIKHLREIGGFDIELKDDEAGKRFNATWLNTSLQHSKDLHNEVSRRDQLQKNWLKHHPPQPHTARSNGSLAKETIAIWADLLESRYLCEVQKIFGRPRLCVFDRDGRCLHHEQTEAIHGAIFGPDSADVQKWRQRSEEVLTELRP